MRQNSKYADYENTVAPHLNAAYNLARWLTHNDQDAEDVVQEASLRAMRFIGSYRGGDSKAWLLKIVRNTCYTWIQKNRERLPTLSFDDEAHNLASDTLNPEAIVLQKVDIELLREALAELPVEFREVLVLREMEGLNYREIGEIVDIPLGTVMSRLARARKRLQVKFTNQHGKED